MPYYRRRTYRRRPTKKRTYRRRFKRTYRTNKRGQKLYLFKRHVAMDNISVTNISPFLGAFVFSLDMVPDYSEFTSLYDYYKINGIKIMFLPKQTQSVSIGSVNNADASSRFFSVLDFNDVTPPATIDDLRQYQSCRMTPVLRIHKRYFKPRVQDSSGTYSPGNPWIDTSSPSKFYYGLKVGVDPIFSSSTTAMEYTVEAKFYLSFKSVK